MMLKEIDIQSSKSSFPALNVQRSAAAKACRSYPVTRKEGFETIKLLQKFRADV
jgi:hypothetical protein